MSRRSGREAFGMSLLDMLCCGFGAAALLFVISEHGTEQRVLEVEASAEADATEVFALAAEVDNLHRVLRGVTDATGARAERRPSPETLPIISALESAERLILVLDMSGSMRVFSRTEAEDDTLWSRADKWRWTVEVVGDLVLSAPRIEEFAVIALTEGDPVGTRPCSGCALVSGPDGPWLPLVPDSLATLMKALSTAEPTGGSNHFDALTAAFNAIEAADSTGAKRTAMVLVTDGLPNHGPSIGNDPLHPVGEVGVQSKLARAGVVLDLVRRRARQLRERNDQLRLYFIGVPWPDDAELVAFGLEIAAAGAGLAAFPVPPPR